LHKDLSVLYLCTELKINGLRNDNTTVLNSIFSVTLTDSSTLEVQIDKDIEFELDHAIQLNDRIRDISEREKYFQLTVYGSRTVPSKEARNFALSQEGSQHKLAEAIVVESLSQKMVFNFMINVERPSIRTKLFTCIEEAKEWLDSIKG
jgi:hypothetical protein